MLSRRQFLTGLAGGTAVGTLAGTATAAHVEAMPEHVSISFNRDRLERYKPRMLIYHLDFKPNAFYAWEARSPEYDSDVLVYWAEYDVQDGVSPYDSHQGDHEPIQISVEDGAVTEVNMSVYHWLRGRNKAVTMPLVDGDRPAVVPVQPWHQYQPDPEKRGVDDVPLRQLGTGDALRDPERTTTFESWLANGLEDALHPGAVVEPWTMTGVDGRESWWREGAGGISVAELTWRALRPTGIGSGSVPQ